MKKAGFFRTMLIVGVLAACVCGIAACSGGSGSGSAASSAQSGAVAATVNDTPIYEAEVTETIENLRKQSGLETEEAWGSFLAQSSMTPEDLRQQVIDSMVNQELVKEGAASLGISIDSAEVDTYVESMKANFDSDEAWQEALEQAGFTEASYRESIETSLLQQAVSAHFEESAEVSDEDIVSTASSYLPYYDGSKRSSHILFAASDEETAKEVLDRINSGDLDFAKAAQEYSTDSSASSGGDVGWDRMSSFVTEYQEALDELDVDQVSDLVVSQYGIHIIKCTDEFTAPEEVTSVDDIPEAFRETIEETAKSTKSNNDYQAWITELNEKATIVVNDMPADVPYNVDVSKYQTADEDTEDKAVDVAVEDTESASAESASAESASAESASAESASAESASAESAPAESASAESASAESASAESASAESA